MEHGVGLACFGTEGSGGQSGPGRHHPVDLRAASFSHIERLRWVSRSDHFEYPFDPLGIVSLVQDPPVVRLPGHPAKAGYILAWRQRQDRAWEALVEYVIDAPGYRGGLQPPQQSWFHESQVEKVPGEDYGRVPRA